LIRPRRIIEHRWRKCPPGFVAISLLKRHREAKQNK
jgi:hypothetical protein